MEEPPIKKVRKTRGNLYGVCNSSMVFKGMVSFVLNTRQYEQSISIFVKLPCLINKYIYVKLLDPHVLLCDTCRYIQYT